jgi:hypothetical protein
MIDLKDKLTVVLTTHILPSAPETHVLESTISSIRKNFKNISDCQFLIYCDSKVDNPNYENYVSNLQRIDNVKVINVPHDGFPYSGLQNNYINSIKNCETPFIFCCEHDWFFLREVNTTKLIQSMIDNDFINFVRFNKRKNSKAHIDNPEPGDADFWETYVEPEDRPIDQPLMKTDCIATHPHIIRKDKFIADWLRLASRTDYRVPGMVELNLFREYKKDISHLGFEKAHRKWGVYNYGSKDEPKIISHTDGSEKH